MNTLSAASDFDVDSTYNLRTMRTIARFAREHDGIRAIAHATHVLVFGNDGEVKTFRSMVALCEWLGY